MNRYIAEFEKISFEQFERDTKNIHKYHNACLLNCNYDLNDIYNDIKLPTRATVGSAGYDFFFLFPMSIIGHDQSLIIPTGLKCRIDTGWLLGLFPKSGLGNKYRARLDDTVAIIDSDYYNCESNEGHILVKISNHDSCCRDIVLEQGKAFCQGIFLQYGLVSGDNVTNIRIGGFGSTGV